MVQPSLPVSLNRSGERVDQRGGGDKVVRKVGGVPCCCLWRPFLVLLPLSASLSSFITESFPPQKRKTGKSRRGIATIPAERETRRIGPRLGRIATLTRLKGRARLAEKWVEGRKKTGGEWKPHSDAQVRTINGAASSSLRTRNETEKEDRGVSGRRPTRDSRRERAG